MDGAWDRFQAGLLELCATSVADGPSPMQWFLGREPRTAVPGSPEPPATAAQRAAALRRRQQQRAQKNDRINKFGQEGPWIPLGAGNLKIVDKLMDSSISGKMLTKFFHWKIVNGQQLSYWKIVDNFFLTGKLLTRYFLLENCRQIQGGSHWVPPF